MVRKNRIPSLKSYNQKNLKEKAEGVNDILRFTHKNNIIEANNPSICRSKTVNGTNGNKNTSK